MRAAVRQAKGGSAPLDAADDDTPVPLTHHDIMALAAPFVAAGWRVDLPRSDRAKRRVRFVPADGDTSQTLELDNGDPDLFDLTRKVQGVHAQATAGADAPVADIGARSRDAAEALARVASVRADSCFATVAGTAIAYSQRVDAVRAGGATVTRLVQAQAYPVSSHGHGSSLPLSITLKLPAAGRMTGEIELRAAGADTQLELPEDLLAVLGWPWSRIEPWRGGWRSALRVTSREPQRSAEARQRFEQTVAHLASTLAEPPAAFDTRWRPARLRVTARRAVPALVCLAVIVAAAAVPWLELGPDSVFRMLIFNSPPLLLAFFFALRELPRIEVPPWPRALKQPSWVQPR